MSDCESCIHYPPSDPIDTLLNCYQRKDDTE